MKIHKTDKERIYFIMDSGACGSIKREDISKLCLVNTWLEKTKVDPRVGLCLSEPAKGFADAEIEMFSEECGMNLLPKLDTEWMGEPDAEKIALDNLGGFSHRNVVESYTKGKTKYFIIEYVGFGKFDLRISYEERGGQVKAVYWAYLEKKNA